MGGGKRNFSRSSNRLASENRPVAIDARARNRLVVGHVRRPLRNRVAALRAFEQANLHGLDRVEHFRGALGEQIGEPGRGARADQRRAIFRHELLVKAELLRAERMVREMGIQIEIVSAQAKRRAKDNLVKNSGRGVDDQIRAAARANDGPQISGVRLDHLDRAFLAQKPLRALRVAIAAPDGMSLAREQLCQQGARAARAENEYPHRLETLPYPLRGTTRAHGGAPDSLLLVQRHKALQLFGPVQHHVEGDTM